MGDLGRWVQGPNPTRHGGEESQGSGAASSPPVSVPSLPLSRAPRTSATHPAPFLGSWGAGLPSGTRSRPVISPRHHRHHHLCHHAGHRRCGPPSLPLPGPHASTAPAAPGPTFLDSCHPPLPVLVPSMAPSCPEGKPVPQASGQPLSLSSALPTPLHPPTTLLMDGAFLASGFNPGSTTHQLSDLEEVT